MIEAKILHIEDVMHFRGALALGVATISLKRHNVVADADGLSMALTRLDQIDWGLLDANVVVLDDRLSEDDPEGIHAADIMQRIEELELPVRVIGLGDTALRFHGLEPDADFDKRSVHLPDLVAALDAMDEPEGITAAEVKEEAAKVRLEIYGLTPYVAGAYLQEKFDLAPEELRRDNPDGMREADMEAFLRIALGDEEVVLLEEVYEDVRAEYDERERRKWAESGVPDWQPALTPADDRAFKEEEFRRKSIALKHLYGYLG